MKAAFWAGSAARQMGFAEFEGKFEKLLQNVERSAIISNVAAVISPVRRKLNGIADIAQPVERILGKDMLHAG